MQKQTMKRLMGLGGSVTVLAVGAVLATRLLFAQGMEAKPPARPAGPTPAADPAKPGDKGKAAEPPALAEADAKLELAKVGDTTITVADLADRINRMSKYVRGRYQSLDKKRAMLDSMVEFEVLAREAQKRGFAKDPEVVRMLQQVMVQRLRQKVVEDQVKESDITDKEIKEFYEKNKAQYQKPETIRISHIVVKDEETAKKVLADVKAKGSDPRAFRELVQQYTIDEATKRRAGDLRYFTKDEKKVPAEVVEAAFKMAKAGDVAGPVKSAQGWHVLKLVHKRPEVNRPPEDPQIKAQIVTRLVRDKRRTALETFRTNIKAKAKIQIYEDRLAAVKIDTTVQRGGPGAGGAPPRMGGLPGGMMPGGGMMMPGGMTHGGRMMPGGPHGAGMGPLPPGHPPLPPPGGPPAMTP
jgi:peptidyl-prolyl cis-trans isomerase C